MKSIAKSKYHATQKTKPFSIPESIPYPGPADHKFDDLFEIPRIFLKKVIMGSDDKGNCDQGICLFCEHYLGTETCAWAIYAYEYEGVGKGRRIVQQMAFTNLFLCPWCGMKDSHAIRLQMATIARKRIQEVATEMRQAETILSDFDSVTDCDPVESLVLANCYIKPLCLCFDGIVLREGENWSPTSHPVSEKFRNYCLEGNEIEQKQEQPQLV